MSFAAMGRCLARPFSEMRIAAAISVAIVMKEFHLVDMHHHFRYAGTQEGIFAGAFANAASAGVLRNIDHWRKAPHNAVGRGPSGGHPGALLDQFHIPDSG